MPASASRIQRVTSIAERAAIEPSLDFRIRRSTAQVDETGGTLDEPTEAAIRSATSGGTSMQPDVRRQMEAAFNGADFSQVRLHAGPRSRQLSQSMQAKAFTLGSDIFFRDGAPDVSRPAGQELIAHELTHTLQQEGGARRRVQRKTDVFDPPTGKDPVTDWVEFSGGTKPKRSPELVKVDTAVAQWAKNGRTMPGALEVNITQLDAIVAAIAAWRKVKRGTSYRDKAMLSLSTTVGNERATFGTKKVKADSDTAIATRLHGEFSKIDPTLGKFAKRDPNIQVEKFKPDTQTPGQMAHTDKNADGTLTDAALKALDDLQIADAADLVAKARAATISIDPSVTPDQLAGLLKNARNPLSNRTVYPELANAMPKGEVETAPWTEPGTRKLPRRHRRGQPDDDTTTDTKSDTATDTTTDTKAADALDDGSTPAPSKSTEITESISVAGSTLSVTYDSTDVHAPERMAALRAAITMINRTKAKVPSLDVYLPKLGRSLSISSLCVVKENYKIADAVFYAPKFFAVSSAITGNPKVDQTGDGTLKFLSTQLGVDNALMHTIIHELGHALHYAHDRRRFHNLNFAAWTGKTADGRPAQKAVTDEVSSYGANNPREMVAEVFLATVTGKKQFSDAIWEMYDTFGGAPIK